MLALHPVRNVRDVLPEQDLGVTQVRVSKEDIQRESMALAKLKATGLSSWTNELIAELVADDSVAALVANWFNLQLKNQLVCSDYSTASRLILMPKSDGKVRPIAIADAWVRFLGRIVCAKVKVKAAEIFKGLQHGVATPGGAELMVHQLNLVMGEMQRRVNEEAEGEAYREDPLVILTMDARNAFNAMRRRAVFDALEQRMPELTKLFRYLYSQPSDLVLSDGHTIATSETGLRQGDLLGPLFFCLGLQGVLEETDDLFEGATPLSYIDDTVLTGRRSAVWDAYNFYKEKIKEVGLSLNEAKTELLDLTLVDGEEWNDLKVVHAVKVLGGPIGDSRNSATIGGAEKVQEVLENTVTKRLHIVDAMREIKLPAKFALQLCSACVNSRIAYLARIVEPSLFREAALLWDGEIVKFVAEWLEEGDLNSLAKLLLRLPRRMGGLGMSAAADISGPGFAASLLATADRFKPKLLAMIRQDYRIPESYQKVLRETAPIFKEVSDERRLVLHTSEQEAREAMCEKLREVVEFAHDKVHSEAFTEEQEVTPMELLKLQSQKHLSELFNRARFTTTFHNIANKKHAAWLLSNKCGGLGIWMDSHADKSLDLEEELYVEAVKERLMLASCPSSLLTNIRIECGKCNKEVEAEDTRHHSHGCICAQGVRVFRHNCVRDILQKMFRSLGMPNVEKEKNYSV